MALVIISVSMVFSMYFYVCVHETSSTNPPKLRWWKWFSNPQFYLVCVHNRSTKSGCWQRIMCATHHCNNHHYKICAVHGGVVAVIAHLLFSLITSPLYW